MHSLLLVTCTLLLAASSAFAEPLPGAKPLADTGDLAMKMVEGIHKYLDREIAGSVEKRKAFWKPDSVQPNRERLKKYLGVVDARLPARMEYVSGPGRDSVVAKNARFTTHAVRWAVLPGIDGEGLLLEPTGKAIASVVAIPDASQIPEQIAGVIRINQVGLDGYHGLEEHLQFAKHLAEEGCRVLVPTLIDRRDELSGSEKLKRATNQPHREFVHRMAFEMGRTLVGYEVQKVLAAIDWFRSDLRNPLPVGVVGYGEGGRVALYSAAVDDRINAAIVSGAFGPRESVDLEPLDRNIWGLHTEFGDAELGQLIAPRKLYVAPIRLDLNWFDLRPNSKSILEYKGDPDPWIEYAGPAPAKPGKAGAAPGVIRRPKTEAIEAERSRMFKLTKGEHLAKNVASHRSILHSLLADLDGRDHIEAKEKRAEELTKDLHFDSPAARQKRQFEQLVNFTQCLWRESEFARKAYFAKGDTTSPHAWDRSMESLREAFHTEAIGKLPEPTMPLNPRTRQVYDEKTWTGHEVMLDVYPDVFAYGIVLLPKDLKPGEKRPVVVCQHGLEGTPRKVIDPEDKRVVYNQFARKLVEKGYIVYAPQNPYYGENVFRQINRKANPLKLSMFSFIIRQHQRTLDWLETLPGVDPKRIAFYGLSYGGKTAMRVPAVEKRYCLSICSGDFNEWIGKMISMDLDRGYMWTREYEMYEFDLGATFNYAEMAALIAPRPFMVERGHNDGVGTDEMVAYEFAKVRYLYENRLKLQDHAEIEFFNGGHEIRALGTFAFLDRHLGWNR